MTARRNCRPTVFVALDATFAQLARSPWFGPNTLARALQPVTLRGLRRRERELFGPAKRLLPWVGTRRRFTAADYGIQPERLRVLPPSLEPPPWGHPLGNGPSPTVLSFAATSTAKADRCAYGVRAELCDRAELASRHPDGGGPRPECFGAWRRDQRREAWLRRWREADLFVFPSRLETFGIVLLEAWRSRCRWWHPPPAPARKSWAKVAWQVLPELTESALTAALRAGLERPGARRREAAAGRASFEQDSRLRPNTAKLAAGEEPS